MLFRFVVLVNGFKGGWLVLSLMFLGLSMFTFIVQPYKKSYMSALDGLLLALLGFLALLIISFQYYLPSANQTLPLLIIIACSIPQLVLLLSVTYRQLKGKQISRYIAGKVGTMLNMHLPVQQENQPSDADQLPHRLTSPNQYTGSLTSESGQTYVNTDTLSVRGQLTPVYTYGSIS